MKRRITELTGQRPSKREEEVEASREMVRSGILMGVLGIAC